MSEDESGYTGSGIITGLIMGIAIGMLFEAWYLWIAIGLVMGIALESKS